MRDINILVPLSVRRALVDGEWAWPIGGAISGWRRLCRMGAALETSGECAGCRSHRPGHSVPVFRLLPGYSIAARRSR